MAVPSYILGNASCSEKPSLVRTFDDPPVSTANLIVRRDGRRETCRRMHFAGESLLPRKVTGCVDCVPRFELIVPDLYSSCR
jgi:hypothetical protein